LRIIRRREHARAVTATAFVYQQYQAKQQNPDLASALGQAQVTPGGDRVTCGWSLSDDQMRRSSRKITFALKM